MNLVLKSFDEALPQEYEHVTVFIPDYESFDGGALLAAEVMAGMFSKDCDDAPVWGVGHRSLDELKNMGAMWMPTPYLQPKG